MSGVEPGATIGILGGGQLGRMLAMACADLGLRAHVYAPETGPAFDVCAEATLASYDDEAALEAFARACAVVTYEFENVPAATADFLAAHGRVDPNGRALAVSQDRLAEKRFLQSIGVATAPFAMVDGAADLKAGLVRLGAPAILKTRRFGYDGKGQVRIDAQSQAAAALAAMANQPSILEGLVAFTREVSVVAARGRDGAFVAYDLCENEHVDHVLSLTRAPACITPKAAASATTIARRIADALDYVGVIAVEMFVVGEGAHETLVVNEMAPRVHNSGHWTLGGADTSQFAQHIRAICGWPLGSGRRRGRIEMRNLLGAQALTWRALLAQPGADVHLYGKHQARPGRKMGHVTRIFPEAEQ